MLVKVALALNGTQISDADAAALLSPTCRVFFSAGSTPPFGPVCVKYDSLNHQFVYNWKIASNTKPATNVPITVTVYNPDKSENNHLTEPITITSK